MSCWFFQQGVDGLSDSQLGRPHMFVRVRECVDVREGGGK